MSIEKAIGSDNYQKAIYLKAASVGTSGNTAPDTSIQSQTCKIGVINPNHIGNSGKLFDSEQEAID